MPFQGRELIIAIGGDPRPGEGVKGLLRRVAQKTGIGIPSLEKSWKRQYESKTTISKLQKAADNANNLASRLEALANDAEMAGRPRREVDELRATALRLRGHDLSTGTANDRET